MGPSIVNCSPQLPEFPNTAHSMSYRLTHQRPGLLTDEAEVIAGEDVGDGHVDLAVTQVEVAREDDGGLEFSCPEQDETRRVRDLLRLV